MNIRLHTQISDGPISSIYIAAIGGRLEAVQELKNISPGSKEYDTVHTRFGMYNHLRQSSFPRIIRLMEHDKKLYLFWEYFHGSDLGDILSKARSLSITAVIHLCALICEAIDYMHTCEEVPMIHGNLCPKNILVRSSGKIGIVGFSRFLTNTYNGNLVLNGYEAPEQFTTDVSPGTDIYSLGKILQTMLDKAKFPDQAISSSRPSIMQQLTALVNSATEPLLSKRLDSVSGFRKSLENLLAQSL